MSQRMFDHPELSSAVTHPYDVENQGAEVSNQWGQRVTSLVPSGPSLFISTSAKSPIEWDPGRFAFLAPDKWKSYGSVYRMTLPGQLSAATTWTDGATTFEWTINENEVSITQDGAPIGSTTLTDSLAVPLRDLSDSQRVNWGQGIYGPFRGRSIAGTIR